MKLRGKLLLVSLSLLVLPWAGWQMLRLVGEVVRDGQEQALSAGAEALARGVALRSGALPPAGASIFVLPLSRAPRLDGRADDWPDAQGSQRTIGDAPDAPRLRLGSWQDALLLHVEVDDASRLRTDAHWPIAGQRDHVRLVLHGAQGAVALRLANSASGALVATGIDGDAAAVRVTGEWLETAAGYAIEAMLPQGYALRGLSLTVQDASDGAALRIHDADPSAPANRARWAVVQRSPALANSLAQLAPRGARLRLYDRDGWLLAAAGEIAGDEAVRDVPLWRRWFYNTVLVDRGVGAFEPDASTHSDATELRAAAAGAAGTAWRRDPYSQRLTLAAAAPVHVAGKVRAVLWLEREADALPKLADRAFSGVLVTTLAALAAVVAVLFVFAGRLGSRIRRLRDAAETALDRDGRVRAFPVSQARKAPRQIADLVARLLDEVAAYTGYLRGLAGTLSHEINTPIAIVRTSLENLESDPGGSEARVYLERARVGVERLGALVRAMSEAGRVEQAIDAAEHERFDLRAVIADCAESYRPLLAPRTLRIELPDAPLIADGAPDLIAQALDKLVDNTRGFCPPHGWVAIRLAPASGGGARLAVANSGPLLPAAMRDKLFDSMVSVRRKAGGAVHLGFGLHIVRLIVQWHGGSAQAADLPDGDGVEFTLLLPPPAR
jgi:two-component system sensor histidine kinase ChvG